MKLLAFAASHRTNSLNRKLVNFSGAYLAGKGIDVAFADYSEFDMPIFNAATFDDSGMPERGSRFAKRAASADGIIISTPEYNWSYPASLKNIIEWTSCIDPYPLTGKTVLLMSATIGTRGGILGLQQLKTPLEEVELFVFNKVFALGNADKAFDNAGKLTDAAQSQNLISILNNYVTFTKKLSNK